MVPELATTVPVAALFGYWMLIGICPPWPPWPPWPPPRPPWPWPWPPPPPPWLIVLGIGGAVLAGWGFTSLLGGVGAVGTRLDFVLTGVFALVGSLAVRQVASLVAGGRGAALETSGPAGPAGIQR